MRIRQGEVGRLGAYLQRMAGNARLRQLLDLGAEAGEDFGRSVLGDALHERVDAVLEGRGLRVNSLMIGSLGCADASAPSSHFWTRRSWSVSSSLERIVLARSMVPWTAPTRSAARPRASRRATPCALNCSPAQSMYTASNCCPARERGRRRQPSRASWRIELPVRAAELDDAVGEVERCADEAAEPCSLGSRWALVHCAKRARSASSCAPISSLGKRLLRFEVVVKHCRAAPWPSRPRRRASCDESPAREAGARPRKRVQCASRRRRRRRVASELVNQDTRPSRRQPVRDTRGS